MPFTQHLASGATSKGSDKGRQGWGKSKARATELPKLFFLGGVALSERYKGTLCASDLLLLLSVMASQQNEVS